MIHPVTIRCRRRRGLTLVELMISLLVSVVLMGGLSAAIMIATSAVQTAPGPAARSAQAHDVAQWIERDLIVARDLALGPNELTITVPDRDLPPDGQDETIRYAWSGAAGASLLRRLNTGPVVALAEDVHAFGVVPHERSAGGAAGGDAPVLAPETWGYFGGDDGHLYAAVLMIVADSNNPSAAALERKAMLESWGATVSMLTENASTASYDIATGVADVVYVIPECKKIEAVTNLHDRAIGVLNESGDLVVPFGFTDAIASQGGTTIVIEDPDHSITQGLSFGSLEILDRNEPLIRFTGAIANGLVELASVSGAPTLGTIEAGGGRLDGSIAPSRRVTFPFDRTFDFASLNGEGLGLLRRCLAWAAVDMHAGSFGVETAHTNLASDVRYLQIATKVTLDEPATLSALHAYIYGAGKACRMALYADAGGEPGALLAETVTASASGTGWIMIPTAPVDLTPGDYWIAIAFEHKSQMYHHRAGGDTRYRAHDAVNAGFLDDWGPSDASYAIEISMYATYAPNN